MMFIAKVGVFTVLMVALMSVAAMACEPCTEQMGVADSARTASLIAVVHMPPEWKGETPIPDGTVQSVKIWRVLKGTAPKSGILAVRHMYGMCDYGIGLGAGEEALLMLQPENDYYTSVGVGCGIGKLPIKEGKLLIEEEALTETEFIKRYLQP